MEGRERERSGRVGKQKCPRLPLHHRPRVLLHFFFYLAFSSCTSSSISIYPQSIGGRCGSFPPVFADGLGTQQAPLLQCPRHYRVRVPLARCRKGGTVSSTRHALIRNIHDFSFLYIELYVNSIGGLLLQLEFQRASPVPFRLCDCYGRRLCSPLPSRSADAAVQALGSPSGKREPAFSKDTGFSPTCRNKHGRFGHCWGDVTAAQPGRAFAQSARDARGWGRTRGDC